MAHEFKEINGKCFLWSIKKCKSSLVSDSFAIQNCGCNLEFEIESILLVECVQLRFVCNGTLVKPITMTLRVFWNSNVVSLESYATIKEDHILWKDKGFSFLNSALTFEIIIHPEIPTEGLIEELNRNLSPEGVKEESSSSKTSIHLEALSRDFAKLLSETSSSDVEVTCEGNSFNAHRIVLGTRSAVFSTMLKSNMVESKTGLIKVEDCKASIFRQFLNYLYSGTLPELSLDSAMQFYEISDKYDVKELKQACSDFLTKNLTESSACEVLILADKHSDDDFRKNVISFIVNENIPQRVKKWSDFCKTHCSLANEVMLRCIQKSYPR